jgi:hypothetical protein
MVGSASGAVVVVVSGTVVVVASDAVVEVVSSSSVIVVGTSCAAEVLDVRGATLNTRAPATTRRRAAPPLALLADFMIFSRITRPSLLVDPLF